MKKPLLLLLATACWCMSATAQCTTANVNWDNLDFLVSTGNYAGFVTAAQSADQRFAFGPGTLRVQTTSNITINGENGTHTGETGAYGTGNDASFATTTIVGSSTITMSFSSSAISALKFSLFDIDNNQKVAVTAFNGAVPVSTTLSKANATSSITFTGNSGNAPVINGIGGDYLVSDNKGAVNVDIAGPVTSVILTFTSATGDFWLSDLQGCVPGSFPTNYYLPSKPWPGQPNYILSTSDTNRVHTINVGTGLAKEVFIEPGSQYVNSLGYDQVSKRLYYTPDDVNTAVTQKAIKYYNFDNETINTLVADVATIGIPYFESGVESGGAAFYNGCLYLGIEGSNAARTSNRKSIIWRISFDASNNPLEVAQVFAITVDNGSGTLLHDWADFIINDGILYNWNSRLVSSAYKVYQYNLQTQALTTYVTTGGFAPKQNGLIWNGTVYDVSGTTIRQYNGTTSLTGTAVAISGTNWVGSSGDGSEAFRPKADFGDAPTTYEPVDTPAVHEMDTTLHLGATIDREWLKEGSTSLANSDGSDEDGVGFVPLLCPCSGNFNLTVKVYNHTGANATLIGWLDYNGNGKFDASEAITATVSSGTGLQNISLFWTNANTSLPNLSYTYLRVRLTSAANSMTTANSYGYFANGEVEDYRVFVNGTFLANNILSFTTTKTVDGNVKLAWRVSEDASLGQYAIERSNNGKDWTNIGFQPASGESKTAQYSFEDATLRNGTTYYRLELLSRDRATKMSDVRIISESVNGNLILRPNPVHDRCSLELAASQSETTELRILNATGICVQTQKVLLAKGANVIELNLSALPAGAYHIQLNTVRGLIDKSLIKE